MDALGALGDAGWYCIRAILWATDYQLPKIVAAFQRSISTNVHYMKTVFCLKTEKTADKTFTGHQKTAGKSSVGKGFASGLSFTGSCASHRLVGGVILSCGSSLRWEDNMVATFHCSFLSHESMDLNLYGNAGSLRLQDFIIPYEGTSALFFLTSGADFLELYLGMSIKDSRCGLDLEWLQISRKTQLVLDAVKKSIGLRFKPVEL
ncbi:uncharacterized oxidoreductase At4g09670-like [Magnolia sinica]|uniref:uncharacterized oxidoreductase At4g09670-like n=1 Tax=Magnolia sinica TaxID=86752 RepID=UPI00265ACA7A|nr:uncharacterized oxidoreductase At4g09670-like [Magnolia sinica]